MDCLIVQEGLKSHATRIEAEMLKMDGICYGSVSKFPKILWGIVALSLITERLLALALYPKKRKSDGHTRRKNLFLTVALWNMAVIRHRY